jgi:Spy/CpxP family protein refolding chaperone
MRVDGIDLRQLLESEKPDQNAVMKKVQEMSELRGQMMKNNVQALLDAKSVLSPEQQERVRQFIGEHFREQGLGRSRMEHHRGRMMTRPGTPPQPPRAPAPPQPPSR